MFKRSVILGLILSCPLLAQVQWEGPRPVSSGISPDMALDPRNGVMHVVAVNLFTNPADPIYKDRGVVYTKIDPSKLGTDDPSQYVLLREIIPNTSSELGLGSAAFAGPSIAIDQAGNPHVCFRTPGSAQYINNIYYTYRTESGWSSPLLIRSNVERGYAVQLAIDKNNVVHLVHGEAAVSDLSSGTFSYYRIQGNTIIKSQTAIGKYHGNDRLAIDIDPQEGVHVLVAPQYPPYEGPIYYYSQGGTNNLARVGDIHSITAPHRNGGPDVFADLNNTIHFVYGTRVDTDVNSKGSIRYAQYKNRTFVLDKAVTPASGTGALDLWKNPEQGYTGWGLGGVSGTSEGQLVVVAYLTKNIGPLYTVHSLDGGITWSAPEYRAPAWGVLKDPYLDSDGRALHVIRGYQNNIYLVYQTPNNTIRVQYLRKIGEVLPTASAGGPYEGFEGSAIAFDASGSEDTGMNAGIAKYEWDWQNDGVYDNTSTQPTIQHTYTDDFSGRVGLRITDLSGNLETADASVQVGNVAPTVSVGTDQAIDENQSVSLSATVFDPGQDTQTLTWQFSEGGSASGPSAQRTYLDDGNFTVIVAAQDDDGGVGRDTVTVQVRNVPPVADAGGPYQGSRKQSIEFLGTATDPGTLDQRTYSWDMDDNGVFETSGNRAIRSWAEAGRYTIWFRTEDDDGGVGIDSAVVTITADEPTVLAIPDQVIQEGATFPPLNLDLYVIHPIQTAQQMVWIVTDTVLLSASISNRQLTVNVPNPDWFGEETLTLTVHDLGGFTDVGQVTYKVQNVNDPPYWKQKVPDYSFDEDKSLTVSLSTLRSRVGDIDSPASQFIFSLQGGGTISASLDAAAGVMRFSAPQNWNGAEDVLIVVEDGEGGGAIDTSRITVNPAPDAPLPFNIIAPTYGNFVAWPDSIACSWERPADPDGETISTFIWRLEPYEVSGNPAAIEFTVHETTFTFLPDPTLDDGVWKWTVTAKDEAGLTTRCEQSVYFIKTTSSVTGSESLPTQLALNQNYPNPFNPETTIHYDIPKEGWIELAVYNSLGQKIRVLDSGQKQAGTYTIRWNADDDFGSPVPSGIYIYRLKTDSKILYGKMMLVR